MAHPGPPLRQSLLRRLLNPSARMLLAVGGLTIAGAVYNGWGFLPFLTGGTAGQAEILTVEAPTRDYARYSVRLIDVPGPMPHGIIESDRRSLAVGATLPVIYLRDRTTRILPVELFVPWTRPIWLGLIGFAALALGLRERDRAKALQAAGPAERDST